MNIIVDREKDVSEFLSDPTIRDDASLDTVVQYAEHLADELDSGHTFLEPLFDYVSNIIETYENPHHPILDFSHAAMLRFLMVQHNHKQKDLSDVAQRSVISEILNRRRQLTKKHIERLAIRYGVSPALFFWASSEC